jgi:uncharacterized protein (DUF362 family)
MTDEPLVSPPHAVDRRTFIVRSAEVGLGATAIGLLGVRALRHPAKPWDTDAFPPVKATRVAVLRAASYEGDLESRVVDGLRAIGADVQGRRVLLKPNFVEYDPSTAINTDPRLVAATVVAMRRLGAVQVVVGEGPGHRRDTQYVMRSSGLLEALRAVDAPFVDLNAAAVVVRRLRSRYSTLRELWLPEVVASPSTLVVSMPKMKTHHWGGVTLSMKNCFGCVPGRIYGWPKNVLHWAGLEESIVDVAAAVRPDLAIVDGITGMEGNGPIQGSPVESGLLVFGRDPVAVDSTAARLMNVDPERVNYLRAAGRFLGQTDPAQIKEVGEDVERSAHEFRLMPQFAHLRPGAPQQPNRVGSGRSSGA